MEILSPTFLFTNSLTYPGPYSLTFRFLRRVWNFKHLFGSIVNTLLSLGMFLQQFSSKNRCIFVAHSASASKSYGYHNALEISINQKAHRFWCSFRKITTLVLLQFSTSFRLFVLSKPYFLPAALC